MPALSTLPAVRSLKRGDVSVADVCALRGKLRGDYPQRATRIVETHQQSGYDVEVYVVDGDLHLAGNLKASHEHAGHYIMLVVLGDLTVDGVYVDCMHEPEAITVVTGDLRARDFVNSGFLEVQGNLVVDGSLIGVDNDCSGEIFGDVRAAFFWPHYHHFKVHGTATFETAIGGVAGAAKITRALREDDTAGLLNSDLLEVVDYGDGEIEVEYIKSQELAEWVATGRSIFV